MLLRGGEGGGAYDLAPHHHHSLHGLCRFGSNNTEAPAIANRHKLDDAAEPDKSVYSTRRLYLPAGMVLPIDIASTVFSPQALLRPTTEEVSKLSVDMGILKNMLPGVQH